MSKNKREKNEQLQRTIRQKGVSNLKVETDFQITEQFEGNLHVSQMICVDEINKKVAFIDGGKYSITTIGTFYHQKY